MIDRIRSFGARRVAVVVLAIGLVGVVAVPTILASSAPPPASTPLNLAVGQADKPARFGRIVRGDVTILKRDATTLDAHFERGEITAKTSDSVTLKSADNVSTTFKVGPDTRIRVERKAATVDDLKVGDKVLAVGNKSASGYDALLIRVPPARAAKTAP
jgi:hypothetical protein